MVGDSVCTFPAQVFNDSLVQRCRLRSRTRQASFNDLEWMQFSEASAPQSSDLSGQKQ